uniref:Uncharacterized protein n=1 Tax=Rhizophora mucronata TaxID=61149 RepID=A0A2P2MV18_RHIMU
MSDVICGIFSCNKTPIAVHHLNLEKLSNGDLCNRGYLWVPPVVKWKSLFPWLPLHVYGKDKSGAKLSHGYDTLRILIEKGRRAWFVIENFPLAA